MKSLVRWLFRLAYLLTCKYVVSLRRFWFYKWIHICICPGQRSCAHVLSDTLKVHFRFDFSRDKVETICCRIASVEISPSMKSVRPKPLLFLLKSISMSRRLLWRRFVNFILVVNARNHTIVFNFVVFVSMKIRSIQHFLLMSHVPMWSHIIGLADLRSKEVSIHELMFFLLLCKQLINRQCLLRFQCNTIAFNLVYVLIILLLIIFLVHLFPQLFKVLNLIDFSVDLSFIKSFIYIMKMDFDVLFIFDCILNFFIHLSTKHIVHISFHLLVY